MSRWCVGREWDSHYNWSFLHDAIIMGVGINLSSYDPDNLDFFFSNWMGDELYIHLDPRAEDLTHVFVEVHQGLETPFDILNRASQEELVESVVRQMKCNLDAIIEDYYECLEKDEDFEEEEDDEYDFEGEEEDEVEFEDC